MPDQLDLTEWETEVRSGERFEFGRNWTRYLDGVDTHRIAAAQRALSDVLGSHGIFGRTFLDVGCGSGIHSLAARSLGATVHSFDYDPEAVSATEALKERTRPTDALWIVERGSILDSSYVSQLGNFDVVYSWGVLHHTGRMWRAISNAMHLVGPHGLLILALYNDQGPASRVALAMKRRYVQSGRIGRLLILGGYGSTHVASLFLADVVRLRNPLSRYARRSRGMSAWRDVVDWVGGYPFEVARPQDVVIAAQAEGFSTVAVRTVGRRSGNNEYVFERT